MAYARHGDCNIHYQVSGSGAPLILIMGLGADYTAWKLHLAAYERHFLCIAIDNRGVGKSSKPAGPYTTAEMAGDVLAVMNELDLERAHIVGISMGGAIAQEFCLAHPERTISLILTASFARLLQFHASVFEQFKFVRCNSSPEDFTKCLQLWIWSEDYFENHANELIDMQNQSHFNPNPQPDYAFDAQCCACITHNALPRMSNISVPTLITAGDKDIFTPLSLAKEMLGSIASAELQIFENSAHTHHWEQLERYNALTTEFMLKI